MRSEAYPYSAAEQVFNYTVRFPLPNHFDLKETIIKIYFTSNPDKNQIHMNSDISMPVGFSCTKQLIGMSIIELSSIINNEVLDFQSADSNVSNDLAKVTSISYLSAEIFQPHSTTAPTFASAQENTGVNPSNGILFFKPYLELFPYYMRNSDINYNTSLVQHVYSDIIHPTSNTNNTTTGPTDGMNTASFIERSTVWFNKCMKEYPWIIPPRSANATTSNTNNTRSNRKLLLFIKDETSNYRFIMDYMSPIKYYSTNNTILTLVALIVDMIKIPIFVHLCMLRLVRN